MSKLRFRAAVGLLTGHTTVRAHLYKTGHTPKGKNAGCVDTIKRAVYTLCVSVLFKLVKDTGSGAVCS
jgi:hypothetical protein